MIDIVGDGGVKISSSLFCIMTRARERDIAVSHIYTGIITGKKKRAVPVLLYSVAGSGT
jgi:hypothetical protein